MEKNKTQFSEFPTVSKEEWLAKLEKDLKGKPLEDLNWHLGNDIVVPPFYHNEDADKNWHPLSADRPNNEWEISEDILVKDFKEANAMALHALEYGATALRFILTDEYLSEDISDKDLEILTKGIHLEYVSTHFQISHQNQCSIIDDFYDVVIKNGYNPEKVKGSLNFSFTEYKNALNWMPAIHMIEDVREKLPVFKLITVDGTDLSVDTKDVANTLAETLNRGVFLFHFFLNEHQDFSKEFLQNTFQFSLPIGKSYFVEIAKIRAFKILWANILAAYEVENIVSPTIEIHFSKSAITDDTNTNMIHATTQAMSAVIGGVNRLTVLPADKKGTTFTKRIARNVQHLLKMESFMDRVHDPAAGSYYVEKMTEQLADKAWEIFRKSSPLKNFEGYYES